ncbi:MAG TPA: HAD family hydrolase [Candidatus Binataceae bacterium]|nr:HAD family hydrolase [Candidatus Binataceae bacterium]
MTNHRFKAIAIDLFNTLVKWDPDGLPPHQWRGRKFNSTIPLLLPHLRESFHRWDHDDTWLEAYYAVTMEIAAERERHGVEVTCYERFFRSLNRVGLTPQIELDALAEMMRATHMKAVREVTSTPAANAEAVRRIAQHYRMALLSNFDDSQTGREIVEDSGVADLFEVILISADVAMRKPNPAIFRHLLAAMNLEPREMLFVGDTPMEDVLGAQRAGIPIAWLSHGRTELPPEVKQPDIVVETLADLPDALGL